ncbi:hypothetical protein B6N13_06935 [Marinomonas sp. UCMA 3892]|uniref:Lipoprotein n=2 Tax=unclassified Marinomonas TaxID=196814 RepID=A6W3I4_MARMS|nr:hypothetical protein [Marinomonas sp. UCMA 3892]
MNSIKMTALLLAVFMTGCSTINYSDTAKREYFSEPPVEEVVEVYVGDYMLNQGLSTTSDYLILERFVDGIAYNIPQGAYSRIGDYKGVPYFSVTTTTGRTIIYAAGLIDTPIALHSKTGGEELCVTSVSYQQASCYDALFKIEKRTITDSQSFQQTLIYNGSVGKKINISYREFAKGTARDAFTNSVEYDMSKSNIINYKGARIEVLDYDNSSIKFKVLKHFHDDFTAGI